MRKKIIYYFGDENKILITIGIPVIIAIFALAILFIYLFKSMINNLPTYIPVTVTILFIWLSFVVGCIYQKQKYEDKEE